MTVWGLQPREYNVKSDLVATLPSILSRKSRGYIIGLRAIYTGNEQRHSRRGKKQISGAA